MSMAELIARCRERSSQDGEDFRRQMLVADYFMARLETTVDELLLEMLRGWIEAIDEQGFN